jgi:hypothetical protein
MGKPSRTGLSALTPARAGSVGAALGLLLAVLTAIAALGETALPTLILAAPPYLLARAVGLGDLALLAGWVGMPVLYDVYFALLAWGRGMRWRAPMPWLLLLHDGGAALAVWNAAGAAWPKYPGQIDACWMAAGFLAFLHGLALLSACLAPSSRRRGQAEEALDQGLNHRG